MNFKEYTGMVTPDMRITGVSGSKHNNSVELIWKWPANTAWNFAMIVRYKEGQELSAEVIQHGDGPLRNNGQQPRKNVVIGDVNTRFAILPMQYNESEQTYYIINQIGDNISEEFHRDIMVRYRINYTSLGLLKKYHLASIRMSSDESLHNEVFYYRLSNCGDIYFPLVINTDEKEKSLIMLKGENLQFELTAAQKKYISLVEDN